MSTPRVRTQAETAAVVRRVRGRRREARIVGTAEEIFTRIISQRDDGIAAINYYAAEALTAARIFWDKADPPRGSRARK